ncbi:hypothetical protein BHE74_00029111 [Ensete ventricosum]|nr:hypothetical protein BHE74_00029111 [Ensete ventricosum]
MQAVAWQRVEATAIEGGWHWHGERTIIVGAAIVADGVADDRWSATEVLGSTSKGRQQPLRRPEGEVEEAATSAWGVTNDDCGYGCCDPREAIAGLGRQLLVLLRSRAGDVVGQ